MKGLGDEGANSKMEMLGSAPTPPFPLLPGFPRLPGATGAPLLPTTSTQGMPNMWPFIWNHISK